MVNDDSRDNLNFSELMSGVKKISDDRINVYRDRKKKATPRDRKYVAAEPTIDFAELNHHLKTNIRESYFDPGIQKKLERKIRQGLVPIDDQLDLHGYNQNEATSALTEFFQQAHSANSKLLIIIHGKGNRSGNEAVLRPLVRHWLTQQPSVLGWCPARTQHGGDGASYVYLRARR